MGARAMADEPLRRLFWHVTDDLDYLVTLARLRILDELAGPEPATLVPTLDRFPGQSRLRPNRVRNGLPALLRHGRIYTQGPKVR
jgi:hypothetical protein